MFFYNIVMLYSLRVQINSGSGKKEEIKEDRDGKFLNSIMTTVSVKKEHLKSHCFCKLFGYGRAEILIKLQ